MFLDNNKRVLGSGPGCTSYSGMRKHKTDTSCQAIKQNKLDPRWQYEIERRRQMDGWEMEALCIKKGNERTHSNKTSYYRT